MKGMIFSEKDLGNGISRRVLAHNKKLMMVEFCYQKGSIGAMHTHMHEQIGLVKSGRFKVTIEGSVRILKEGDSYYICSGQPHGVISLEENGILIDVFTPPREDFLELRIAESNEEKYHIFYEKIYSL